MRVLWLIDSLTLGGAEALVASFARAARARGIVPHVAFLKRIAGNPFEEELRASGVQLSFLDARTLRDRAAYRRLLALLARGGFDVLHAHLAYASIWGAHAGARAGVPVVATLHVAPEPVPRWSREAVRRRLLVRALRRHAAAVLAVSGAVREAWAGHGLPPASVEVVPNGVDVGALAAPRPQARARLRAELGVAGEAPLALAVAALRPGKGLETLIAALGLLAETSTAPCCAVAGDGPLRGELERAAAERGVRIHWLGLRRDVPDLLAAADLFVLPSERDALPTVLLEAMAASLPVVATPVGGIPEIVEDGESGVLVAPGDAAALAAALRGLAGDPATRRRLGASGQRRVHERFTLDAWVARLEAVYRRVAARGAAA